MIQLKEIIVTCKYRQLLDDLEKAVNEQIKDKRKTFLCYACLITLGLVISAIIADIVIKFNNLADDYPYAKRFCTIVLIVAIAFTIIAGKFLAYGVFLCFDNRQHPTLLANCKGLRSIKDAIDTYRNTEVMNASEAGVCTFLEQFNCMKELVPNWAAISLLKHNNCVALLDKDEGKVYLYARNCGEQQKLKLNNTLALDNADTSNLILVIGRDTASCCSEDVQSLPAAVIKQGANL